MQHLVILHGAIGAKDQLEPLAAALKDRFIVHTINFPGHGGNAFPAERFSIRLFADAVCSFLEKRKINNAHIFGYSMGGYVGMYLAKYFPGKVSRLVTLATKFDWNEAVADKEINMLNADTIEEKVPLFAKELQRRHTPQDWKQLLLHTKQLLTDLGSNNELKPEDYADINVPCLLMLGDRDKMVTLDETVNVYKKLQHGSLAVLPQTQHPIEKVDLNVIRFFLMHFLIPA